MVRSVDSKIPELVGLSGAAGILRVSRQAAHKMVESGQLPGRQVDGRTWVFRRAAVEAVLDGWETFLPPRLVPEGCTPPSGRAAAGFGAAAIEAAEARSLWSQLLANAAGNPGVAVMLGAALAAPFLASCDRTPFWVVATGPAASGKSSALTAAAAVLGDPRALVHDRSPLSVARLRRLTAGSLMPTYLEEALAPEHVWCTTADAGRVYASRTGGIVRQPAPLSIVFSTAEQPPPSSEDGWNMAMMRRVVMVGEQFRSAAAADEARRIAVRAYGWPLEWLRTAPEDQAPFDPGAELARIDYPLHEPILADVANHLAAAVAGARLLETLAGTGTGVADAALDASAQALSGLASTLRATELG